MPSSFALSPIPCLGVNRYLFICTQEYSSMVLTSSEVFRVTTMILRMPGYITSSLEDIYAFHMCRILGGIHRLASSHQLLLTRNQQLLDHSRISHEPCVPTKHFPCWVSFLFTTQDHRFCSPASLETKQSLWLCQRCSDWVAKLQKVHMLVSTKNTGQGSWSFAAHLSFSPFGKMKGLNWISLRISSYPSSRHYKL